MLLSERLMAAPFTGAKDYVDFAMALDLKGGAVSMRPTNGGERLIYKYASGGHGTAAPSRYCSDLSAAFALWHERFPDVFLEIEKTRHLVVVSAKGLRVPKPLDAHHPSHDLARAICVLILRLEGL